MDLISTLAAQLGVDPEQAKALAGGVIGGVQGAVAEEDDGAAKEMESAIPELSEWKNKADAMTGGDMQAGGVGGLLDAATDAMGGGGLGGLLGAAAGALGGEQGKDVAAIITLMDKIGIDSSKAALVAPTVLSFLKDRVPAGLLDKVLAAAPLLAAVGGGGDDKDDKDDKDDDKGGGLGGLLGGLLG